MGLIVVIVSQLKNHQKVKKLSKVIKPQKLEKLQRSLVQKNFYQSINLLSIRYKELKLLLKL